MKQAILNVGCSHVIDQLTAGKKSVVINNIDFLLDGSPCSEHITPETEVLIIKDVHWTKSLQKFAKLFSLDALKIYRPDQYDAAFTISPEIFVVDNSLHGQRSPHLSDGLESIMDNLFNAHSADMKLRISGITNRVFENLFPPKSSPYNKGISDLHHSQEMLTNLLHKVWPAAAPKEDLLDVKNEIMQLVLKASQNMQAINNHNNKMPGNGSFTSFWEEHLKQREKVN